MKRSLLLLLCSLFFIVSCETVPITGRSQLSLVSSQELTTMSFQAYRDFLSKHPVVRNTPAAFMVQRAGGNIQRAVGLYFARQQMSSRLSGYAWEFNLVQDKAKNAWCMPGGKVCVYTGILPMTRDESGLAVVMGHEIAHAVANHASERMSQQLMVQMGGAALSTVVTQNQFLDIFGLGSQVGLLLPYSRIQESEADRLGLIFMAMAGYDPRVALGFWQRMAASPQGQAPSEFLSTHPSDVTRINNLKVYIPEALKYYLKR
ncbi:MAG: M48 family metallopeptidase [Proteobacteria bacterium]|nr:M48 family metallopeptidase [Pseudomonadota bacterium]